MQEALQQPFVEPPVSVVPHAKMSVVPETQRDAFLRAGKLPPTLVIQPGDELAVMREEIFGPVLPIKTYS